MLSTSLGAIDSLSQLLSRIPGIGSRSARRMVLFLLRNRDSLLTPIIQNLQTLKTNIKKCDCGNLDEHFPCGICADFTRHSKPLCIVEDVVSLWAIERTGIFQGMYHVLDNILSPISGIGPESLGLERLSERVAKYNTPEIIIAINPTIEGQVTTDYIKSTIKIPCSTLRVGIPMGSELDYLDIRTIISALEGRE